MNLGFPILNNHKLLEGISINIKSQISNNIYYQVRDETYWEILMFFDFEFGIPIKDQMFKVLYNIL